MGRVTVVYIRVATCYGLNGPGIDPGSYETFRTCPDWCWDPPRTNDSDIEQLSDIAAGRNQKDALKPATLFEFWSQFRSGYPEIAKYALQQPLRCVQHTAVGQSFRITFLLKQTRKQTQP